MLPILVTPVEKVDKDVLLHLEGVYVWPLEDFRGWAKKALLVVRELRRDFPCSGDLAWRATACEKVRQAGIDAYSILQGLYSKPAKGYFKQSE